MADILDRDWSARMAANFGGRLSSATFVHSTPGTVDPNRPAFGTQPTEDEFSCDAIPFAFELKQIDGELIHKTDYQVMILRGTIKDEDDVASPNSLPVPGDTISVPRPGETTPRTGTIAGVIAVTAAFITVQVRGPGA